MSHHVVKKLMKIYIRAHNFPLTDALRSHAEQRLRFALTCCDHHIQRVLIWLSDINNPCGGTDKRCQVQVVLDNLPDVVVVDIEANLNVAIDRASDRAGRSVGRRLAHQRDTARPSSLYITLSISR